MLPAVSEAVTTMAGPRYEDDFFAWTQHQAMVLRSMAVADNRFDRENVAEEIEDLGRGQRDAVRSQIRRIIEHFLKLAYSPAQQPRFDWIGLIIEARSALGDKISPTLRRDAETMLARLYDDARDRAEAGLRGYGETQAADKLPAECPYTIDEILRRGWYPEPPGEQP
jgi:hypothetical protein